MLAHHFRRGQIRTKAFGHNLALLLRCPNPTSLVPRDHLDTLTATTLMTSLMSVLSVGQGRSGREWQGRFHDQPPSQRLYPPQCVTAVSLTAVHRRRAIRLWPDAYGRTIFLPDRTAAASGRQPSTRLSSRPS